MHIRMVTSEDAGGDNMEQEEQHESEPAEEDREVDVNDYDYAMDVKLEGGCGAEHLPEEASEDEMEEVEIEADIPEEPEEEDYETDYGSVALAMEDEEVYRDLDPESYDEYRWECLGNAVGVGHYVVKKRDWRAHADPTCSSTWWPGGAHQGGGLLEREAPLHDALRPARSHLENGWKKQKCQTSGWQSTTAGAMSMTRTTREPKQMMKTDLRCQNREMKLKEVNQKMTWFG